MSKCKFLVFFLALMLYSRSYSAQNTEKVVTLSLDDIPYKPLTKRKIAKGLVFAQAKIKSQTESQKLEYMLTGLHQLSCRKALRRIARYEDYDQYLDFIRKSSYKNQKIHLEIKHPLISDALILELLLPRLDRLGKFNFQFDRGFLKHLKGEIHISEYQNRCLIHLQAHWKGAATGYSDTLLSLFSETIGRIGMEKIFRISAI